MFIIMGKYHKIYIPDTLLDKEEKRRHKPRNWNHVYFFKGNRYGKFDTPVVEEWEEPFKVMSYNKNTLYTCKEYSNDLWDYYKILKSSLPKRTAQIGVQRGPKKKKKEKLIGLTITHYPKDKPYILKF